MADFSKIHKGSNTLIRNEIVLACFKDSNVQQAIKCKGIDLTDRDVLKLLITNILISIRAVRRKNKKTYSVNMFITDTCTFKYKTVELLN